MPEVLSRLATETMKDPYVFDFIAFREGVSEYKLLQQIPDELKSSLPSIEEIEQNLGELMGGQ